MSVEEFKQLKDRKRNTTTGALHLVDSGSRAGPGAAHSVTSAVTPRRCDPAAPSVSAICLELRVWTQHTQLIVLFCRDIMSLSGLCAFEWGEPRKGLGPLGDGAEPSLNGCTIHRGSKPGS